MTDDEMALPPEAYPERCPVCDELVYRWYTPSFDRGIYGEDVGVDVHFHVTHLGLAMHVYDEYVEGEDTYDVPYDGPQVRT